MRGEGELGVDRMAEKGSRWMSDLKGLMALLSCVAVRPVRLPHRVWLGNYSISVAVEQKHWLAVPQISRLQGLL